MAVKDYTDRLYYFVRDKRRKLVFMQTKYFCDFSFIHINKTGGSSIEHALRVPLIHETATTFRNNIGVARWDRRFSFSIVRNPWDRVVSHFHYRQMTDQTGLGDSSLSFKDWVRKVYVERAAEYVDEEKMFLTQSDWVTDEEGRIMVDYIGRFEQLDETWSEICRRLNREHTALPHVKKSSRQNYRDYYDQESRDIVENFFKKDVVNFGYRF